MVNGSKLGVEADAVRLELDRIVSSSVFSAARRSKMLLRYVVERSLANSAPKEFEIAVEVLRRGADYDPEIDAAVRVEASRLRSRLREYYDTEGQDDPIFIDIPKGGYGAVFASRGAASRASAPGREYPSPQRLATNGTAPAQLPASPEPESEFIQVRPQTGQVLQNEWFRLVRLKGAAKWWLGGGLAVTVIVAVLSLSAGRKQPAVGRIRSLAILPLQNLSGNPQEEYFVDGLTDALITELAHTPDLRVVSRTSIMQYKENKKPLRQIASELDVDAVVEGSVVRSGNRVRITAQLIDVRDDRHLWAQSYEEPITDILILQDNIVREIALQTRAALTPGRDKVRAERVNPAAYDAYLRGLYFLNQRDIDKSVEYLQQAVALDSTYALAYAGLAEALTTQGVSGGSTRPHEQSQALAAAKRAIELDPESGDAYAALGFVEINFEKDWQAGGRDLEKGIALSPGNSLAEMQYSIYLDAMGRPEEAVSHMRRALQLDPRSFLMNRHLGATLYFARHYDEALFYLQRAVEMEPTRAHYAEGWITRSDELALRWDDAERTDLQHLAIDIPEAKLARLRSAYQRGGWKAYQTARIGLIGKQPRNGCDLFEVGESYIQLDNPDRAFSWLGRGIEAGCYWADSIPVDPLLDGIRSDPRFSDLLRMAHLGNVSKAPAT
jgi:TolB-like protein/Tfp pilus assembly protein PilF